MLYSMFLYQIFVHYYYLPFKALNSQYPAQAPSTTPQKTKLRIESE